MRGITAALVAFLAAITFPPGVVSADVEVAPLDTGRMGFELNQARGRRSGLPALARRPDLDAVAQRHTDRMAADGGPPFHSGDPAGGLTGWERVGEIVGRTDVHDPDWQAVLTHAFLESPRHRDELLDARYLELGVGAAASGDVAYVTAVFMRRSAPASAAEADPAPRRLAPSSVGREQPVLLARPPSGFAAPPAPDPPLPAAEPHPAAPSPAVVEPAPPVVAPAPVAAEPPPIDLTVAAVPIGISGAPVVAGASTRVGLFVVLVLGAILLAAFGPPGRRRAPT